MAILFLRSNDLHDISAGINNGGWTHTCRSLKVQPNDTVVVFGNMEVCKAAGVPFEQQMVLVGRLIKKPYRLTREDMRWPSNRTGTPNKYLARFDLAAMDLMSFDMIPGAVDIIKAHVGHMNGGKYVS